ncbi:MAG: phytanoyl-CoA dioxygenase family protein [Planctomycetota bacterium]|nr:phytanoyl-CoA dioxygenase family protein [Planctomycetota bacterium]
MSTSLVIQAPPFSPEKNRELADRFHRDGCLLVPDVLTPGEVAALTERVDRIFADPRAKTTDTLYGEWIATRLFEWDTMFRDMLVREPLISLVETILGPDCHLIANNFVRNAPGQAIDTFHVDDLLWFPLPDDLPRYDARTRFPCFLFNVQIPLTDLLTDEFGPTQFVPGSHYSGRQPNDPRNPTFEGKGPVSIHCKAGDIYLQHSQVWHRGAPNKSTRTRYLLQQAYSMRFIAQRFYPFLNYRMPDHVLEGASDRLLRVLGKHGKGPYG